MSSSQRVYPLNPGQNPRRASTRLQDRLRAWLPVAAFSMVFVAESTAYFGADRTSAPLRQLAQALFGSGVNAQWELTHHLLRKTGHFMGYGLFSRRLDDPWPRGSPPEKKAAGAWPGVSAGISGCRRGRVSPEFSAQSHRPVQRRVAG
jgi:hypothetical protein